MSFSDQYHLLAEFWKMQSKRLLIKVKGKYVGQHR